MWEDETKPGSLDNNTKHLHLIFEPDLLYRFFEILQNGFAVKCQVGISIKSLLCEELAFSPQYVAERITTIFLDGKCVDNIDSAIIREGSTLALSAAMPGLAGAIMRRGGVYASLRSSITYKENNNPGEKPGTCSIKLFNLLIREMGPVFLERGILIKPEEMRNFLRKQPDGFWERCSEILLNGKPVERNSLLENNRHTRNDFLYLTAKVKT